MGSPLATCIRQISGIEQSPKPALTYVVKCFWQECQDHFMGKEQSLEEMVLRKLDIYVQKNGVRPLLLFSRSAVSDSSRPRGLQHARLPCPSSSPGACWNSCPLSQWCDPMDYTAHGVLQARTLEWVAFPFSRGSSRPKNQPRSPTLQVDSLPAEPQGEQNQK